MTDLVPRWKARAWAFRAIAALPPSRRLRAGVRLLLDGLDGENFADPRINGEARVIDAFVPGARVVFDVGAADGTWSALALAANPGVALHAFEPGPAYADLAARPFPATVRRNAFGLGAVAEERALFVGPGTVFPRYAGPSVPARFVPLDAYCAELGVGAIDLLKLDVEGMELDVLRGARGMLDAGAIGAVQFEYSAFTAYARVQLRDFFELLEPRGYRLHRILPRGLEPCVYDVGLENYRYKNLLAVRIERAPERGAPPAVT